MLSSHQSSSNLRSIAKLSSEVDSMLDLRTEWRRHRQPINEQVTKNRAAKNKRTGAGFIPRYATKPPVLSKLQKLIPATATHNPQQDVQRRNKDVKDTGMQHQCSRNWAIRIGRAQHIAGGVDQRAHTDSPNSHTD